MDYLSRLVGNSSPSPSRHSAHDIAQQRLIRFKTSHDHLQQIWRRNSAPKPLLPVESVRRCLDNIERILQDEVQTSTPLLCARHVSTFQTYTILAQVASLYHDELVIHPALEIFKILIDSEEIEFLQEKGFVDAFIGFVSKISTTGPVMVSIKTETKIVEVLFTVASKIRLQPQLLTTWFRPLKSHAQVAASTIEQAGSEFTTRTEQEIFPLFYLILDYVHHEGRVGDFARTGLLYLIEATAHSEALERWIVEGDLATLMASGLGALYSQLSRKLVISFARDPVPAIISFSETTPPQVGRDAEETHSPELRAHLTTFLSYLAFWQDVLEHCRSHEVTQSLLDHFKLLFLQQLLYPSLIESSDSDGGSSVAVLTYLRCIVESINHKDLLHVTLQYLLALPEAREEEAVPVRPTTLARRRKSSILVTNLAQGQEKPMPDLFTLVDLVLTSLRSPNQQTVRATLQLVSVLLDSHHKYAILSLIKTLPLDDGLPSRTIDAHSRDTTFLFSLAEDLIEHDDLAENYDAHLQDARTLLESHCCSSQLLALLGNHLVIPRQYLEKSGHPGKVQPHRLCSDDSLSASLIALLEDFLTNDIGTNLALTQCISILASCENTQINGWLLCDFTNDPSCNDHDSASDDASDHDDTITLKNPPNIAANPTIPLDYEDTSPPHNTISPIFATLDRLVDQVDKFRHTIEEFDLYLSERRHVFKVGEHIDKAVANDVPVIPKVEESAPEEGRRRDPRSRRGHLGSISERLMSETSSSNVSRSSSPRGRRPSDSLSTPIASRINRLRISPSPSPSPSDSASRSFSRSPLRDISSGSAPLRRDAAPVNALHQKVRVKSAADPDKMNVPGLGSETSSMRSGSTTAESKRLEPVMKEVTLSQLLTSVIILQEFILELAAIVEVRASLFGEVRLL